MTTITITDPALAKQLAEAKGIVDGGWRGDVQA